MSIPFSADWPRRLCPRPAAPTPGLPAARPSAGLCAECRCDLGASTRPPPAPPSLKGAPGCRGYSWDPGRRLAAGTGVGRQGGPALLPPLSPDSVTCRPPQSCFLPPSQGSLKQHPMGLLPRRPLQRGCLFPHPPWPPEQEKSTPLPADRKRGATAFAGRRAEESGGLGAAGMTSCLCAGRCPAMGRSWLRSLEAGGGRPPVVLGAPAAAVGGSRLRSAQCLWEAGRDPLLRARARLSWMHLTRPGRFPHASRPTARPFLMSRQVGTDGALRCWTKVTLRLTRGFDF